MGAYRDENKNGTWYCKFSYVNWKGEKLYKKKSVNPLFCKEEKIIDGTIFFDTCSLTVRFFGTLKGEKQKENEIRK